MAGFRTRRQIVSASGSKIADAKVGSFELESTDGKDYVSISTDDTNPTVVLGKDGAKVGVAVASPDALLHVQGTAISTTRPAFNADTVAIFENDANCSIQILTKDSSSAIAEINMGGNGEDREGNLRYIVSEQKMEVGPRNAGSKMGLYTAGTQRVHIDASGNTAVGASTPEHKFHVQDGDLGVVTNSDDTAAKSLVFTKSRNATDGNAKIIEDNDILGRIDWYGADASSGTTADNKTVAASIFAQVDGSPGHEDMPGSIRFATTGDDESTLSNRMVIRRNGNVGLGDTEPNFRCVIGGGLSTPIMYAYNSNTSTMSSALTATPNGAAGAIFDHRASDSIYCMNTTSTNAADARSTGIAFFGRVDLGSDGNPNNDTYPMMGALRVKHEGSAEDQAGYMAFYTNDGTDDRVPTERMRIRSNGKVGINTNSPGYMLEVKGATTHSDVVAWMNSTGTLGGRLETYDNEAGCVRVYGANKAGTANQTQHVLNARDGSNGEVSLNVNKHDCDFTMSSSNSTKMLHVDASLDQVVIIDDNTACGKEHLDETDFSSHAEWDVTGDFSDAGGDATYTHSSGAGTLTQVAADLAWTVLGDRYYIFTYTVSAVTNDSDNPMAATITTGIAHEAVSLTVTANGTYKTAFLSKASPGDFVISATSTTSGNTFTLDDVSLKSAGGELVVGNKIRCANSNGNILIGDTGTGAALNTSSGYGHVLIGRDAAINCTTGHQNTAVGEIAMGACQATANLTTAIGRKAGYTAGNTGTYVGAYAGEAVTGYSNVAVGYASMNLNGPDQSVAVGRSAHGACTGDNNVAVGAFSLDESGAAGNSVAVGYQALTASTNVSNTGVGFRSGQALTSGQSCTFIGADAATGGNNTADNQTVIGANSAAHGANTVVLGSASVTSIDSHSDRTCDLGTTSYEFDAVHCVSVTEVSDERLKEDITDTVMGLDFINSLRPVSYKFKDIERKTETVTYETEEIVTDENGNETVQIVTKEKEVLVHPGKTHSRKHQGLLAQEVKASLDAAGIDAADFGGFVDGNVVDGTDKMALRYTQFIGPLIKSVQQLTAQNEILSLKIKALEEQGN